MQKKGFTDVTNNFIEPVDQKSHVFVNYTPERISLQKFFGLLTCVPLAGIIILLFKFVMKYKIQNLKQIRKQFQEIIKDKSPLVICANHLTFIDSALIIWALASCYWYQFNFKYYSWNLPAGDFFGKMKLFRIIAFLGKCIFIHRDASSEHHNEILNICKKLLKDGQIVTIFPEGKRSRTGKFDPTKITYGVGKIIQDVPNCRVLCVYIRGDKQDMYSNFPEKGSSFSLSLEVLKPQYDNLSGRDACGAIVSQIANVIKNHEDIYFNHK